MKRLSFLILLAVMTLACLPIFLHGGAASAKDAVDNFTIEYPNLEKYLFLNAPTLSAVSGNKVAAYDGGLNKIIVAGASRAEYDVALSGDEKITDLAFLGDKLYYLTDRSRLFEVSDGEVDIGDYDLLNAYASGSALYFYNGNRTVYAYDGSVFSAFSDTARLIYQSTCFAVAQNTAYFLKENSIYSMPLTSGTEASKIISDVAASRLFAVGGKLYAFSATEIKIYSEGALERTLNISDAFPEVSGISHVSTDGTAFSVLSSVDKAVYLYDSSFRLIDFYGCASGNEGWLNSPQDVQNLSRGAYAVWDKGNDRVQIIKNAYGEKTTYYVGYAPGTAFEKFAAAGDFAFFSRGASVYYTSTLNPTTRANFIEIPTGYAISGIAALGNKLFVLDDASDTVFYCDLSEETIVFKTFCYAAGAEAPLIARGNTHAVLYAKTADGVRAYTSNGLEASLTASLDTYSVDYVGNIVAAKTTDDGVILTTYARSISGFDEGVALTLQNAGFALNGATSIALDTADGHALISDGVKHVLALTDVPAAATADDYVAQADITVSDANPTQVSYAKLLTGGTVLKYNDNYNLVSDIVTSGDTVIVLDEFSTSTLLYVMTKNGLFGYVNKAKASAVTPDALSGKVIALHDTVGVYNIPSADLGKQKAFDKNTVFTIIDDCVGFDLGGPWYKISYTEGDPAVIRYGFILKTRVMSYTEVEKPVEETVVYGKAKSQRIGATVNLYAVPDTGAAVLHSVADGTKLVLLENYDENSTFTLVEYEGKKCYVLTAELQMNVGLTGGQIAAIVLASVTLLITFLYFIISRRTKKISKKEN